MPLKLNVGLSRKIGEANYGSRGASVNLEMDLDGNLVGDPTKLRARVAQGAMLSSWKAACGRMPNKQFVTGNSCYILLATAPGRLVARRGWGARIVGSVRRGHDVWQPGG